MLRAIICSSVFLFFFLLGTAALADQGPDDLKCFPGGKWSVSIQGEQAVSENRYTIPRKQVLMEEATATW